MRLVVVGFALCLLGCGDTTLPPPADMGRDLVLVFPQGCSNGSRDGDETDIDCGGGTCMKCEAGKACLHGSDCDSTICDNNVCAGPSCTDKLLNGSETDVDCGGSCPGCAMGQKCLRSADCMSGNCVNNTCQPGACMNNIKDGMETDVDCGGPTCPACANGKMCLMASDCQVNRCVNNVCQPTINCTAPMANCDGNPQSGCNVNLNTDAKNCGKCGMVCPMNMSSCINGACQGGTEVLVGNSAPYADSATVDANKIDAFSVVIQKPSLLLRFGIIGRKIGPKVILALYSDKNGNPDQLLAKTPITPLAVGSQEIMVPAVQLVPQMTYYLAILCDSPAEVAAQQNAFGLHWTAGADFAKSVPQTFPNAQTGNLNYRNLWIVVRQ